MEVSAQAERESERERARERERERARAGAFLLPLPFCSIQHLNGGDNVYRTLVRVTFFTQMPQTHPEIMSTSCLGSS